MRRVALTAIFLVLAIVGVASYLSTVRRAEQAMKVEDARVIGLAVRAYTVDKGSPPKSMDELVSGGYLKAIPGRGPAAMYGVPVEWPDLDVGGRVRFR